MALVRIMRSTCGIIFPRKPDAKRLSIDKKTTLGGAFTLLSHAGKVVTDQTLMGHWTVIYFGYTSCPEDCPQELEKLAQVIKMIGSFRYINVCLSFLRIQKM